MPSVWDTTCQGNQIVRSVGGSQITSGDQFSSFRADQLPGFDDEAYEVTYPALTAAKFQALLASAETTRGAAKIAWTPPQASAALPFVIGSFSFTARNAQRFDVKVTFILLRGVLAPS